MKMIKNKIYYIMDILIVLIVILSTRSVYSHININLHFNVLLITVMLVYLGIKFISREIQIKNKKVFAGIVGMYYAYLLVFYIFNSISDIGNYISSFAIILPMFILLFLTEKGKIKGKELLKKYSNIICILAVISLVMYVFGPVLGIIKPEKILLKWGNEPDINSYWNIHFLIQKANIMNNTLVRNTGIFTESPMYCLHLTIALATQLFLTERTRRNRVIILFLTILTSLSAIGIIIASILIISKMLFVYFESEKKKECSKLRLLKKIIIGILCIALIILSLFIFYERKNKSESLNIRIDDYKASFSTWREKPIFGCGYLNSDEIEYHMNKNRMHNKGLSNSLLTLLAQSGVYLFLLYLIPFSVTTYRFIKEKKYNYVMFNFTILLLFITSIFEYTTLMLLILALQYYCIIKKQELSVNGKTNTSIYVITHKKFNKLNLKGYIPIQVGTSVSDIHLEYIKDNQGDNISVKNKNFCELTGLYWIWKNDNSSKNIGIVHYRRYFVNDFLNNNDFLDVDDIESILKDYDMILPKKEIYGETAIEQYSKNSGFKTDFDKVRQIIEMLYPDYLDSYDKVMNNNKMYQYNMFICNKEIFNNYCKWLFDILFELEKNIDLTERNDYQKRIYGFISERLLNVWVSKNKMRIKEYNVINTDEKYLMTLRIKIRRIKNLIKFKKFNKGSYDV